jgi:secretion/DNA translocation related TadE-like protein
VTMRQARSEHGSVSIVAAGIMSMMLVIAMGGADLARVLTMAARAQTAADAAALAAAQELALPSEPDRSPGEIAAAFAARNDATLTACSCEVGGTEAVVTVTVRVGALMLAPDDRIATARARAVVQVPPDRVG